MTAAEAELSPHRTRCLEPNAELEVFRNISTRSALALWPSSVDKAYPKNIRMIGTEG